MEERQEVKSLKKALRALVFLNGHGEATVTDVARAIGVPRTTSYRLLETLAREGYVERQAHSDLYRLTSLVRQLSSGFSDVDLVIEVAKPIVVQAGVELGWPIALATPRGTDMVARITTDHDTSLAIDRFRIGFSTPMLHSPSGVCYLAFVDEAAQRAILSRLYAEGDARSAAEEKYEAYMLSSARARGYCQIRYPEYREAGIAVPLLVGGNAIGGIVMRYIKSSMGAQQAADRFHPVLRELAERISGAYEAEVNRRRLAADRDGPAGLGTAEEASAPHIRARLG